MKVCMLVTNSVKKDPRVQREAVSSVRAGFEVLVIGCEDENYDPAYIRTLPYGVRIHSWKQRKRPGNPLARHIRWLYKLCRLNWKYYRSCVRERPDIIHANDFDTLAAAYLASRRMGCKAVYDSHELYADQPMFNRFKLYKRIIIVLERHMIRRVHAVVSVSHAAARVLSEKYRIKKPVVVTNGSFYFDQGRLMDKEPGFHVLYHGIISPYRGYEEFAAAAGMAEEGITFIVRGYGPAKAELVKYVAESGLCGKVRFDPPVEISELIPMASRAHVGVVLTKPHSGNYTHTVSNKLFEYIQARIPVVLSDVPEHRYINDRYNIGIVIEDVTAKAVARAVNTLYADRALYQYFCSNLVAASKVLCWENESKKLIDVYQGAGGCEAQVS